MVSEESADDKKEAFEAEETSGDAVRYCHS